jgi:hypothetical protein
VRDAFDIDGLRLSAPRHLIPAAQRVVTALARGIIALILIQPYSLKQENTEFSGAKEKTTEWRAGNAIALWNRFNSWIARREAGTARYGGGR